MTISYNWLSEYLPKKVEAEDLSKILTSIGLEVESVERYESIKGGLEGLVVGEVVECERHPNADKLKITKVDTGDERLLQIVCGAPNVATGQKVIVAIPGTTMHPLNDAVITMKVAKIRGIESEGMICAGDEIGLSDDHEGIIILPKDTKVGTLVAEYFKPHSDLIFEIGLTPNRMDAMSHLGVAKDVCAYLSHHEGKTYKAKAPYLNAFYNDNDDLLIKVSIENLEACSRYSGISIKGITVKESPEWLKDKLKAIGQKPINNIVDITNFILHEAGQPLHAFDADEIKGKKIIVKNLPEGSVFTTLDGKERKLTGEDLMICDAEKGICIAGVYGGINSGIKSSTKNIFLESAWFNPVFIRRTSMRHELRTDAAIRFEKGVDISNTVNVLKRAVLLIKEIAGGEISSEIVDVYPSYKEKIQVELSDSYLKKLSGKIYPRNIFVKILESLDFEIIKESSDRIIVEVPYGKMDISIPADIVEEIVRIDGLDNINISSAITITPATEGAVFGEDLKEKFSDYLTGLGFQEILTNSITNSSYYSNEELRTSVKMINNLTAELNILRLSMLETALECIAYNINRKNNNLRFFEFGKIYFSVKTGSYKEEEHFCLYLTGYDHEQGWKVKSKSADFFAAKGIANALLKICGIENIEIEASSPKENGTEYFLKYNGLVVAKLMEVAGSRLQIFDINQPVYFIDFNYSVLLILYLNKKVVYKELGRFQPVQRDLAIIVDKSLPYSKVEKIIKKLNISKLQEVRLFDVFESVKLGDNKKSFAVTFVFIDETKTLTDKEIDSMMQYIIQAIEMNLKGEIRK